MQPNLQIGLIDLLSYFMPGALLISFGIYYKPDLLNLIYNRAGSKESLVILTFILISYLIGFFMTQFSSLILKFQYFVERNTRFSNKPKLDSFFPQLQIELRKMFGEKIKPLDEYAFSFRLVREKCPLSMEDIQRFYVYMILARNLVMTSILISLYLVYEQDFILLGIALFFAIISLSRYLTYQRIHTAIVFRTAYLYFVSNKRSE